MVAIAGTVLSPARVRSKARPLTTSRSFGIVAENVSQALGTTLIYDTGRPRPRDVTSHSPISKAALYRIGRTGSITIPARQTRGLERRLGNDPSCCNCWHARRSWRQPVAQRSRRNASRATFAQGPGFRRQVLRWSRRVRAFTTSGFFLGICLSRACGDWSRRHIWFHAIRRNVIWFHLLHPAVCLA